MSEKSWESAFRSLERWLRDAFEEDGGTAHYELSETGPRLFFSPTESSSYCVLGDPTDDRVLVGFATSSRNVREGVNEAIEDSGGDLAKFLEDRMTEEGDEAPGPAERFEEDDTSLYTISLSVDGPEALAEEDVREEILHCLRGSLNAFAEFLEE